MQELDWFVLIGTLVFIAAYGAFKTRRSKNVQDYLRGGDDVKWWTIGLSVMATQASAITFLSTPGQAYTDGMRFVQFYFGLPLAMVNLGVTLVPFLHGARVFTAYEFLEKRFDAKTRSLTSFLFLVSRAMSCGTIISAPAVVFSAVFGWPLTWSVALIGVPTVIYTVLGGVQAVTWADVTQMVRMARNILLGTARTRMRRPPWRRCRTQH